MKKLIAALVAGLFATAAFAQASGGMGMEASAPAAASAPAKKAMKKHTSKKSHKKAAAASGASM
ncbi:MAG TPA: hypothetical protein VNZ04_09660 [Trinickia sp.]|jgi:hypothetical protein|nr:hypothetical protein [Trinickia sp.]